MRRFTERSPSGRRSFAPVAVVALMVIAALAALPASQARAEEMAVLLSPPPSASLAPAAIEGIRLPLSSRWKASYGLGLAADTGLTWTTARFDQSLAFGTRHDGAVREDWRHFLGLEYEAVDGFSVMGGIAKAGGLSGGKANSTSPTGYERLRLNAGARWRGEAWGIDGSFSFIPTGAARVPSDASFLPGTGGGGSTYYLSLTVSRRF